jgi:hypothetical protein
MSCLWLKGAGGELTASAEYLPAERREAVVLDDEVDFGGGIETGWCPGQHGGGRHQESEALRNHDVMN